MSVGELEESQPVISDMQDVHLVLERQGVKSLNLSHGDLMLIAASLGQINIIRFLEKPHLPLTYKNAFGDTLLHFAAKAEQTKMIWYLIQRGVDASYENKFEQSAMFMACETGSVKVLHILCSDQSVRLDKQDKFGDTLLHLACRDGHLEVAAYLLRSNKRLVNMVNQEGKTALTVAVENGHTPLVQLCREKGGQEQKGDRTRCVQQLAQ